MSNARYAVKLELLRPTLEQLFPSAATVEKCIRLAQLLQPGEGMRRESLPEHYYNVAGKTLQALFGTREYPAVMKKLTDGGGVLRVYNEGSYIKGGNKDENAAIAYRIREEYLAASTALKNEARVEYSEKLRLHIWKDQDQRTAAFDLKCKRHALTGMTRTICRNVDNEQAWVDAAVLEQRGLDFDGVPLAEVVSLLDRLSEGLFYGTSKDANGRKHDPVTNTHTILRNYYRINGKPVVEMDFQNSQYYFLALMMVYPEACFNVLTSEAGDDEEAVQGILMALAEAYEQHQVVRDFAREALAGRVYEWIGEQTGRPRPEIKGMLMGAVMSDATECLRLKNKLAFLHPLMAVTGALNGPNEAGAAEWKEIAILYEEASYQVQRKVRRKRYKSLKQNKVSQLLQRFESRMVVDNISITAVDYCQHPFTTIHDSFMCSGEDFGRLQELVTLWFDELGIPAHDHPKVKAASLLPSLVPDATPEEMANVPKHYLSPAEARDFAAAHAQASPIP